MTVQKAFFSLVCLLLLLERNLICGQGNNITFSPSTPLCIGETVLMICYVIPPTSQQFIDTAALISFNGSVAANLNTINTNGLAGVDTTRYTADTSGLGNTVSRPGIRLTITDYQASDGATNFGCHGFYSGGVPSPVLVSEYPQRLAGRVVLTPSSLTVKSNISQYSDIFVSVQHNLSTVDRPDRLSYNLTLHSNGAAVDYLNQLTPAQANSTPFSTEFELNNYYHISVIAENCAGESDSVNSKTFVLIELQTDNGKFQTSSSNSSRIEWLYTNLVTPAGGFEQDYLSEDYFNFTIDNESITEFSLYLPQRFDFALPPGYDSSSRQGLLKISFNGNSFANVPIVVEETADNILTIVLIIFLVLLVILLGVVVVITVVFVVIYYKKRQNVKK